ncbi:MAG: acyl carrier protein [Lachnospiraceae bacterium]|nr:acyl carrier protein [Lachnospiraceae bacterium]
MYEKLKQILKEQYGIEDVSPSSAIKTDLGLDSFELMDLICLVEDTFGVEIEEDAYHSFVTVQDFCDHMEKLISDET